ncbi:MAG TPA: amidohydrolase family protein [Gaiellaceae bacterium]|nr:amidohydrolase family protein [Gaiellaceae bacterium]
MNRDPDAFQELQIGRSFDTREALRNASRQAQERGFDRFTIVDADAHHYETESWAEIVQYIEDPLIRHEASGGGSMAIVGSVPLMLGAIGNQDVSGRILRQPLRRLEAPELKGAERDTLIIKRTMEAMGIDFQIVFPTPMLSLGLHPVVNVEVAIARAYARWIGERVLASNPQLKSMLYLPFNDPDACLRIVEEFGEMPGVVGFMVTGTRHGAVHSNAYAPLYRALEERGLPLGFHGGYRWQGGDRSMESLNRFLSVHALGFPFSLMIHLTNWVVNGLPERFPKLNTIWIEGGLAWVPFMMQRLDHEYAMRSSEAPLLKRMPSEYIREMYFTSQPLESTGDHDLLAKTFELIGAETQLLYASDYPHWDFDVPSVIYDLPFLGEDAKRAILGGNACRLFGLPERS